LQGNFQQNKDSNMLQEIDSSHAFVGCRATSNRTRIPTSDPGRPAFPRGGLQGNFQQNKDSNPGDDPRHTSPLRALQGNFQQNKDSNSGTTTGKRLTPARCRATSNRTRIPTWSSSARSYYRSRVAGQLPTEQGFQL